MRFSKHLRRPFLTLWHLKFRARIRPSRLGLGLEPLEDRIVLSQFLTEPNGTLNQAFDIGMTGTDTQPTNFSAEGRLGDDGNQFESDIDYIKVVLNGGDRIGVGAAFRENTLNGIGLVNASGELVDTEYALANDPRIPFPAAQGRLNYFHWTAKTSGIYYVIINQSAAEDDYSIHIKVVPRVPLGPPGGVDEPPPAEPNDTISEAIPTDFNFLGQYYQSGLLGDNPHLAPFGNGGQDVDMYKLDISDAPMPGLLRIARVDVNLLTTSFLDGVSFPRPMPAIDELFIDFRLLNLHIFDASGNELTYDPKLSLDGSTNGENIHVQFFLPDTAATYYLGINSSGTYDPLLEGSSPGIIERAAHEIPYVFSVILGTLIVVLPDPDINLESAQVLSGNSVQFSYTTTDNPGPFEVGLYRSADGITYSLADQVGDLQVNPPSPGVISLPSNFAVDPDKPFLIVVADPTNAVFETNKNNNLKPVVPLDIEIQSAQFQTGDTLSFSYQTQNFTGPFSVAVYRSDDSVFDAGDVLIGTPSTYTPNITSHVITETWTDSNPNDPLWRDADRPYLLVVVDPADTIGEYRETNNVVAFQPPLYGTPGELFHNVLLQEINLPFTLPAVPLIKALTPLNLNFAPLLVDFNVLPVQSGALASIQSDVGSLVMSVGIQNVGPNVVFGYSVGQASLTVFGGPTPHITWHTDRFHARARGVPPLPDSFPFAYDFGPFTIDVSLAQLGLTLATSLETTVRVSEQYFHDDLSKHLPYVSWVLDTLLVLNDPGSTELLVTDSEGRRTGQQADGTFVSEIPFSAYLPDAPLVLVFAPQPSNYVTEVRGRAAGNYSFVTARASNLATYSDIQDFSGTLEVGQSTLYSTVIDPENGSQTSIVQNTSPVLDAVADLDAQPGAPISIPLHAYDTDLNDTLTYSLDTAPFGASIDSASGLFTWTAMKDAGSVQVTVRITDSGNPALSDTQSFAIHVAAVDAPLIFSTSNEVRQFLIGGLPLAIDPHLEAHDSNDPHVEFSRGQLTVKITQGGLKTDLLSLPSGKKKGPAPGDIALVGTNVLFHSQQIGVLTGGKKGVPLRVQFGTGATEVAVNALLKALNFKTKGKQPLNSTRTVQFVLQGAANGSHAETTRTIQVLPKKRASSSHL